MRDKFERYQLSVYFRTIVDDSRLLLADFEKISSNKEILELVPSAELAYMHAIIINIGKIFSDSKNEPFRLKQFKNVYPKDIQEEIACIENQYKPIIGKIITNRNMIVAHLDKDFTDLCFSDDTISKMEKNLERGIRISEAEAKQAFEKLPRSTSMAQERYTPTDLKKDLPVINELLDKAFEIWKKAIIAEQKII